MNRILLFLLLCSVGSLGIVSCNEQQQEPANKETATAGTIELQCDAEIAQLMQPVGRMFDSAYPNAHVTLQPVSARDAMAQLFAGKSRGIIIARPYLHDEDSLMVAYKVERHKEFIFARDALVFFVKKDFPLDTISLDQLKAILQSDKPLLKGYFPQLSEEPVILCPDEKSSEYGNILLRLTNNKPLVKPIRFVQDAASVRQAVQSEHNAIGIGYLSHIVRDSSFKALRIGFTDSTGKYISPKTVHQAYVYMEKYPLSVEIRGYLFEDRQNLPWGFFSYAAKNNSVQKYFLDAGIVPAFAQIHLVLPE